MSIPKQRAPIQLRVQRSAAVPPGGQFVTKIWVRRDDLTGRPQAAPNRGRAPGFIRSPAFRSRLCAIYGSA